MSIADELMKLDELKRSGTLTDEEYVKAKAAVVSGDSTSDAHTTPTQLKEHSKIPWGWLITLSLVILAFFTNPDTNSLASASKKKMEEGRLKDSVTSGITSRIAAAVLLDTRYERKNYYVFSIGIVTHRLRLGGPEVKIELLGAFGHWWFEFVDTPLYDPAL